MASDVFEETPSESWSEFSDNPFNVIPEPSLIFDAFALSGKAFPLTWVSGNEGVDCSGKWSGVKGGDIVPDWGRGEISGSLARDKALPGVLFPFDIAPGVKAGLCEHKAHIKATGPAAQAKSVSGTWHHVIHPTP